MKTSKLEKYLIAQIENLEGMPWVEGYTDFGSFRPDGSPKGSITLETIGGWLWVKARFEYEGTTMDQTTDRLSGDPYYSEIYYDWVGPANSAPKTVAKSEDLEGWALINTRYVRENNDVGYWGSHSGRWVETVSEEGEVTIRVASGRYEDVSPESTTSVESVNLSSK